jgi:cell division protein FtsI (penicillin-binding protein 3)
LADRSRIGRFRLPWRSSQRVARREVTAAPPDWRGTLRTRVLLCAGAFAFWTVAIEARLVYLQVVQYSDLMARAERQQLRTITPPAKRGEILDRNGHLLAYSVDADTVAADPSEINDPAAAARAICGELDACDAPAERKIAERLGSKRRFEYVARRVSPKEARRLKALELPGLLFYKESRRYYPNKELASHVLGYVGLDNVGLAGLESTFDARIRGREGKMLVQLDSRRHAMYSREERPPTAGEGLELTIDEYLQFIAERELRIGVDENAAAGGSVVIMRPQTGEILALANWPTFNPNSFASAQEAARRNRAIQDLYEPGSTFKVVTASAAIEEQVLQPQDPVDCAPGHITFGARTIRDTHAYGVLPFIDVIAKSSNVGAIRVGARLGAERLGRYISRFGFGQALGPDFRGESPGIVWNPALLDASALASVSMGYQIAVTPLQMASAVSAVANGGELMEPRLLRAFIRNGRREEVPHKVLRRAITPNTAATLTEIMEAVVARGTAKIAQMDGYTIAGKTGTASKLVNGRYSKSDYNASFVGFVPSRQPEVTIVVVIDSPHAKGYYGATVSAPIFKRIAESTLRHLGIGPTLNAPPPVLIARHDARSADAAPQPVRAPVSAQALDAADNGLMPDVRGLGAREALRVAGRIGMRTALRGDGFVIAQEPGPGEPFAKGDACVLTLGRRVPAHFTGGAPQ